MQLPEPYWAVRDLLETGGGALWGILFVTLAMWTLILERYWYFRRVHPGAARAVVDAWAARADRSSWYARQIRRQVVSELGQRLRHTIRLIHTLVALCPLLGLLGTVIGMIEVFQVMAIAGSGNARAMASGVSKATVPTMAGMVAALSGLYFSVHIDRFAREERQRIEDRLVHH